MKIVAVIMDMDDVDVHAVIGPYDTQGECEQQAQIMVDNLNNIILPGHARVHEWDYFVQDLTKPTGGIDTQMKDAL